MASNVSSETTQNSALEGQVRRARFDDYEAILDLDRNVYEGLDYMPAMFHPFMHSKQHILYVFELYGVMAGFVQYRLNEFNPEVVASFSGRKAVRFRRNEAESRADSGGTHYTSLLTDLYAQIPSIKYEVFVSPKFAADRRDYEKLYEWNTLVYLLSPESLNKSLSDWHKLNSARVEVLHLPSTLSYLDAVRLLQSTDRFEQFFRRFCKDYVPAQFHWRPMNINKSALKELLASSAWIFASPEWTTLNNSDTAIESLSYSSVTASKIGIACDVFFYGDDPKSVAGHVLRQAEHLAAVCGPRRVGFTVNLPSTVDKATVTTELRQTLGDPATSHMYMKAPFVMGLRAFGPTAKL